MREFTTTSTNPFVDHSHEVWAWEIPVYLFLGGLVAGLMIITGYFLLKGRWRLPDSACFRMPGVALVLLSLGMLALFLDLEHKLYVWRLYLTFEVSSPMSWGSWILIAVYPALIAAFVFALPEGVGKRSPRLAKLSERLQTAVGANLSLASNLFNWLGGDDDLIAVDIKNARDTSIRLTDLQVLFLGGGFLVLLPLLLLSAGGYIWWRRRRR